MCVVSVASGCGENFSETVECVGLQAAVRRQDTVTGLSRVGIGIPCANLGDDADRCRAVYRGQQLEGAFEIALAIALDGLIRLMDESLKSWEPALGRRTDLYDSAAYFGRSNKKAALINRLLRGCRNRMAKAPKEKADACFADS